MTLRDSLLPVFAKTNQILQDLGVHKHRVIVCVETYSAPIGTQGAVLASNLFTEILPRPAVYKLSEEQAAFVMATVPALAGQGKRLFYGVTRIPQDYSVGGFRLRDLISPAVSTTRVRCSFYISGNSELLDYPGTKFDYATGDESGSFTLSLQLASTL